jgi:RNA polymerase sigma-70 factor (ECF subfamily)
MPEHLSSEPRPPSTVDDTVLVQGLKHGEEWAFEALVRVFGGRMLSTARRLVGNEEDARDVVQSAYLSAFRAIGAFEGAAQLSTWLHRIVVNTALMRLRSRKRKPEESIDALLPAYKADGHHVERFPSGGLPADRLLERQETRRIVRAAIAQLPETYRTVLILRDIEELSTQEAAEMLDITPAAVKVRLHRARQGLLTLLRRGELLKPAGRPGIK